MGHRPPEWDARFPDRKRLRAEAHGLADCVRDQLLARIPEIEIRGVYLKGSSVKAWESPLDYVPEISDVDIHVWFRNDADVATASRHRAPGADDSGGHRGVLHRAIRTTNPPAPAPAHCFQHHH